MVCGIYFIPYLLTYFACSSSEEIGRFRSGHNKYKTDFKSNTNQAIATNKCYAMALNSNKMKDILNNNFFSIEFFNEDGLDELVEITGIDYEEVRYEYSVGNFLVGQTHSGKFYFFSESDKNQNEITFNSFKRLVEQAIA